MIRIDNGDSMHKDLLVCPIPCFTANNIFN
jgi:hypothetical protein